jgi:hypothetical protein
MYSGGANVLAFAAGGTNRLNVKTSGIDIGTDGSPSAPSITINNDTDTGFYRSSNNEVAIAVNGANAAVFGTGGLELPSGNGVFKVKIFSGTLTSSNSSVLSITGTILGASGRSTNNGSSSDWYVMENDPNATDCSAGTSRPVCFRNGNTDAASEVTVSNADTNSSNDYYVTVIYQ